VTVTNTPAPPPRMLVVEDDPDVRSRVARELHLMGRVQVDVASDGTTGLRKALGDVPHDLILLDLVLPDLSGLLILRALRASGRDTPVLVISGAANPNDLVAAADDERVSFLPKPFEMVALDAWIQRMLRQTPPASIRPGNGRAALGVHRVGNLRIDAHAGRFQRGFREGRLSPREARLAALLAELNSQTSRADVLAEHVWRDASRGGRHALDALVSSLRHKIDGPEEVPMLITVRGIGYRLDPPTPYSEGSVPTTNL
jgi:two-component system, OmpR family, response regulator